MIQKMRDLLIGNEENRTSILYIVAICLIAGPVMIIFFGNKREKEILCRINSIEIKKNIINLKIQEQKNIIKNIYDALGNEMAGKFIDMVYGGRSIKDYVYIQEIDNAILKNIFKKNICAENSVSEMMIKNTAKNNIKKMESISGEMVSKIATETEKYSSLINRIGLTADQIDEYVEDSFNNSLTMNIIRSIFSVLEKRMIGVQKKIKKIDIEVYEMSEWKKYFGKEAKEKSKNTKEELLAEYENGIKKGMYRTPEEYSVNINIYTDNNKGKELEKRIKVLGAMKTEKRELIEKIKKEFKKYNEMNIKINKYDKENIFCDNKDIEINLLEEIVEKSRLKGFFILRDEKLYVCEIKENKKPQIISFDKALYIIEKNLLEKKAQELMKKWKEELIYDLEKNKKVKRNNLNCREITIKTEEFLKENLNEDEKHLKNKIVNASLRIGAIFTKENDENIKIYYTKNIEKDEKEKNERIVPLVSSQMIIECLKNNAKIEEYNKKEVLSEIEI
jgi:hypothetical protein